MARGSREDREAQEERLALDTCDTFVPFLVLGLLALQTFMVGDGIGFGCVSLRNFFSWTAIMELEADA